MSSLWLEGVSLPRFPPLEEIVRTTVLVIGGGMTGLLCAHFLKEAGIDTVLVEANALCSGVTKDTTAKITAQHGLIYHKLLRRFGTDAARQYLRANLDALDRYRALCQHMDCDFQEADSFVYSRTGTARIQAELHALGQIGYPGEFADQLPLPFPVAGAVKFPRQAQFHPLKFAAALTDGLNIYEHTPVRELVGTTAVTDRGKIQAQTILVATHFPLLNKHGSYFMKLYQHRSYVLALAHAADVQGMYVDAAQTGLSFRNAGDLLLLGGGGHRTGKQGGGWAELREIAARYYPQAQVVHSWATQDCIPLDDMPYIGAYSARTDHLYTAAGFQKWGMTSAMVAAALLTDLVQGKDNPYAALFSPSRTILRPQLAVNAAESTLNLLTPTRPRCPHMGCALKWNRQEHSWDCPCHGSRFAGDGTLIDNPATGDLKRRK